MKRYLLMVSKSTRSSIPVYKKPSIIQRVKGYTSSPEVGRKHEWTNEELVLAQAIHEELAETTLLSTEWENGELKVYLGVISNFATSWIFGNSAHLDSCIVHDTPEEAFAAWIRFKFETDPEKNVTYHPHVATFEQKMIHAPEKKIELHTLEFQIREREMAKLLDLINTARRKDAEK